jgi:hypothetical protein
MPDEFKMIEFVIEDGKLIIGVDPNKDGQKVLEVTVDLAEVPDEILSVIQK